MAPISGIGVLVFALLAACGSSKRTETTQDGPAKSGGESGGSATGGTSASGGASNAGNGGNSQVGDAGGGGDVRPPHSSPLCEGPVAPTSQLPRLTNEQYGRTVRDLLGVTTLPALNGATPASLLAPDHPGSLTELDWSAYLTVGEAIAKQVIQDSDLRGRFFLTCSPSGDGSACLSESIVSFGRRAFRRPLSGAEIARFETIAGQGPAITETGSPEEVAEVLLNTFLVSPSFIQRSEISETKDAQGNFTLSPHEVASRLSYLLWNSMPDQTLELAADANLLTTNEQVLEQAQRMLDDPKARDAVAAFHRSYLRIGAGSRWGQIDKDPALFPAFEPALAPAMVEETEKFFDAVVFDERGSFQDLVTSPLGFVNASTAAFYGLDSADFGAALEAVTLDAERRPGFLTRIGFLSSYAHRTRTSPTLRGSFVLKDVLGFDVGAPPLGAPGEPLPSSAEYDTNRKRVTVQTARPECSACHTLIDAPGFVLEAYDAVGAWQTTEADTGAPIDTAAEVLIDDAAVQIENPAELMQRIARSPSAQRHYAKRWVSFAYGRDGDPLDACMVDQLATRLATQDFSVLDLFVGLTQFYSFRARTREAP